MDDHEDRDDPCVAAAVAAGLSRGGAGPEEGEFLESGGEGRRGLDLDLRLEFGRRRRRLRSRHGRSDFLVRKFGGKIGW